MMSDFRGGWGSQAKWDKIGQGGVGSLAKIGHPIFWDSCDLKKSQFIFLRLFLHIFITIYPNMQLSFATKFILTPILKANFNYFTTNTFAD